eukprot:316966-Amphidinium_carterae.1
MTEPLSNMYDKFTQHSVHSTLLLSSNKKHPQRGQRHPSCSSLVHPKLMNMRMLCVLISGWEGGNKRDGARTQFGVPIPASRWFGNVYGSGTHGKRWDLKLELNTDVAKSLVQQLPTRSHVGFMFLDLVLYKT